ncbi:MAG TPA: TIGR03618 family F420-dependent PPOX class oxidoreductase [Candidatus Limnocylindrales bacterium]
MRRNLTSDDVRDLLEMPIIAVLATRRPDDTILLSPVWFEWHDGGINVWAEPGDKGKIAQIRRDPRVSIVVANSEWPYKGLEIRTQAKVSPDGFRGVLERTARRYMGEEAAQRMLGQMSEGLVIRIEPGSLRAWDYADEV